jgi:hypothetical protein
MATIYLRLPAIVWADSGGGRLTDPARAWFSRPSQRKRIVSRYPRLYDLKRCSLVGVSPSVRVECPTASVSPPRFRAMLFVAADPNWFYSTLAQATAALVGLAGAFLVQQLLNQRAEISPVRTDIRQDLKRLRLSIEEELRYAEVALDSLTEALRIKEWHRTDEGVAPLNVQALHPERGSVSGEQSLPFIDDAQAEAILTDAADRISALRDEMKAVSWEGLSEAVRVGGHLPAPAQGWLADPNLIPRPAWEAVAPGTGLWPRLEMQGNYAAQWWRAYDKRCVSTLANGRSTMLGLSLRLQA